MRAHMKRRIPAETLYNLLDFCDRWAIPILKKIKQKTCWNYQYKNEVIMRELI